MTWHKLQRHASEIMKVAKPQTMMTYSNTAMQKGGIIDQEASAMQSLTKQAYMTTISPPRKQ